ncbi:MAG: glycerophosphodiester phosphodiesterase [Gammaproteobacteria bacterium]|nr:MAG: glycerophosphodiester phosphodiesterase [Gammaproteobacteria bacterium]RLA36488.1 MAG: glycerophosphodiester phosphodiesterase [Gammaproteobacteria bacterium]
MAEKDVLIIAHRGACGYLPEHTLEAKAFAYALGADYIEQDVVATRDDELVVLHDIHLELVTNVAERFPDRKRADGRFYARDFDLTEIKSLNVWERRKEDGKTPVYPKRFPTGLGNFQVPTLQEEIALVQGLNRSTGRNTGIYPEIKSPAWHREEGVDLSVLVLQALEESGYKTRDDRIFLQCFDAREVRRIREDLGCELKMVQLIGENSWGESDTDYEPLKTAAGLAQLAETVEGVGPWIGHLMRMAEIDGHPVSTGFVSAAHAAGLQVHPYTFRADELAPGFESLPEMVRWFVDELKIDGLFTDFTDIALAALRS